MKIKCKVAEPPTGRYRAFERRSWPCAYFEGGVPAAQILCADDYTPARGRGEAEHAELTVWIADHRGESWEWRALKKRAATLAEAKELVAQFYERRPDFAPKEQACTRSA